MHGISFSSEWISSRKLFAMFYWLHLGLATNTVHCICISGLWTPQEVLLKLEAAGLFTNEQLLLYDLYSFKKPALYKSLNLNKLPPWKSNNTPLCCTGWRKKSLALIEIKCILYYDITWYDAIANIANVSTWLLQMIVANVCKCTSGRASTYSKREGVCEQWHLEKHCRHL